MTKLKSFLKSTKGIIIILLCAITFLISIVACCIFTTVKTIEASNDGIPLRLISDALKIGLDEQKARHLLQCEIAIMNAIKAAGKKNYPKTHTSAEEAVQEMSAAAGPDTPLTCSIIELQAGLESSFEKWSVVERLERHQLKTWPNTKAFANLVTVSRNQLIKALEQQDKYDEALQMRSENLAVIEKNDVPADHEQLITALDDLSSFYSEFQEYDKAFAATDKAMALSTKQEGGKHRENVQYRYLIEEADLKRKAHSFSEANALYDRAITLNSKSAEGYSERGFMRKADLHNFTGAIDDYNEAIELINEENDKAKNQKDYYPTSNYFALIRRSAAYCENKQYEKAIADATASITNIGGHFPLGYIRRGDAISKSGNLEKALEDFSAAEKITRSSDKALTHYFRGQALLRAGHHKEALADFDKCIEEVPRDPRPYSCKGEIMLQQKQPDKALSNFNSAEKCLVYFAPKHNLNQKMNRLPEWKERMAVDIYTGRAKVYDALKRSKQAKADREKAKEYQQIIARALQ